MLGYVRREWINASLGMLTPNKLSSMLSLYADWFLRPGLEHRLWEIQMMTQELRSLDVFHNLRKHQYLSCRHPSGITRLHPRMSWPIQIGGMQACEKRYLLSSQSLRPHGMAWHSPIICRPSLYMHHPYHHSHFVPFTIAAMCRSWLATSIIAWLVTCHSKRASRHTYSYRTSSGGHQASSIRQPWEWLSQFETASHQCTVPMTWDDLICHDQACSHEYFIWTRGTWALACTDQGGVVHFEDFTKHDRDQTDISMDGKACHAVALRLSRQSIGARGNMDSSNAEDKRTIWPTACWYLDHSRPTSRREHAIRASSLWQREEWRSMLMRISLCLEPSFPTGPGTDTKSLLVKQTQSMKHRYTIAVGLQRPWSPRHLSRSACTTGCSREGNSQRRLVLK